MELELNKLQKVNSKMVMIKTNSGIKINSTIKIMIRIMIKTTIKITTKIMTKITIKITIKTTIMEMVLTMIKIMIITSNRTEELTIQQPIQPQPLTKMIQLLEVMIQMRISNLELAQSEDIITGRLIMMMDQITITQQGFDSK